MLLIIPTDTPDTMNDDTGWHVRMEGGVSNAYWEYAITDSYGSPYTTYSRDVYFVYTSGVTIISVDDRVEGSYGKSPGTYEI